MTIDADAWGSWNNIGVLIWVKELRYFLLGLVLLFHLWLEYSLNIPLSNAMFSAYILFVDARDLKRTGNVVRRHLAVHFVRVRTAKCEVARAAQAVRSAFASHSA